VRFFQKTLWNNYLKEIINLLILIIFYNCLCRKLEQISNPYTPPIIEWVKGVMHWHPMDSNSINDLDMVLLDLVINMDLDIAHG
jgi:hypothetical protein